MIDDIFSYGYELLRRLFFTPLDVRCVMALIQVIWLAWKAIT